MHLPINWKYDQHREVVFYPIEELEEETIEQYGFEHLKVENRRIEIRVKLEVCITCRGRGVIVNPSIDGNGLSREDFEQDPDFMEEYMSGVYDIQCPECHGRNVSPEVPYDPKWENMSPQQRFFWNWVKEEAQHAAEVAGEQRRGA